MGFLHRGWRRMVAGIAAAGAVVSVHASSAQVHLRTAAPAERGFFADLAADASTGMGLIESQIAKPLRSGAAIPILLGSLGVAVLLLWPIRLWATRRLTDILRPSRQRDFLVFAKAFGCLVVTSILFVVAGLVVVAGLNSSLRLLPEAQSLVNVLFAGCVISGIGLGVGEALRSRGDKELRPVVLPPGLEATIGSYTLAAGIVLGLVAFVDAASRILHASATSSATAQVTLAVVEIIIIARFLTLAGRARQREAAVGEGGSDVPAFAAFTVAWAALLIACIALLTGSLRFATNLLQNMLWAALLLATAWLMTRFLDALIRRFLGSRGRGARFAIGIVGIRKAQVEQASLLISAGLSVVIWLLAILMVLVPLFGTGDNVVEQVRPGPVMEAVRAMHLSPRSLMVALIVLLCGIVVTRMSRGWLEQRFLPATGLGIGARTSIVTSVGYAGTIVALVAASGALGLQLDKITLIASALTVGVGFGLQAIIQNFVSGLILLFERPIQLGDRVLVSGSEGTVHRMRVRATELKADDGSIAIIPNSAFISSTVVNKGDNPGETSIEIEVTVFGCEAATTARDVLMKSIATCNAVDQTLTPRVRLRTIRDDQWHFSVRFHPRQDEPQDNVISDVLFDLAKKRVDGIRIHAG